MGRPEVGIRRTIFRLLGPNGVVTWNYTDLNSHIHLAINVYNTFGDTVAACEVCSSSLFWICYCATVSSVAIDW